MADGHKVAGGDRLGKTIIFAKNQRHAEFIEERFDATTPSTPAQFARVITHNVDVRPEPDRRLLDQPDKAPHIAISVDMLDTGIDVPEVVNLVFFKLVGRRRKFWQMIGRGTRLCPDLFGPGEDKRGLLVFDFCRNLEYFSQDLPGAEGAGCRSPCPNDSSRRASAWSLALEHADQPTPGAAESHGEAAARHRRRYEPRQLPRAPAPQRVEISPTAPWTAVAPDDAGGSPSISPACRPPYATTTSRPNGSTCSYCAANSRSSKRSSGVERVRGPSRRSPRLCCRSRTSPPSPNSSSCSMRWPGRSGGPTSPCRCSSSCGCGCADLSDSWRRRGYSSSSPCWADFLRSSRQWISWVLGCRHSQHPVLETR